MRSPTTTELKASSSTPEVGETVTYTSTVSPVPDGGTVAFEDEGSPISGCETQTVNTTTGKATCEQTYDTTGTRCHSRILRLHRHPLHTIQHQRSHDDHRLHGHHDGTESVEQHPRRRRSGHLHRRGHAGPDQRHGRLRRRRQSHQRLRNPDRQQHHRQSHLRTDLQQPRQPPHHRGLLRRTPSTNPPPPAAPRRSPCSGPPDTPSPETPSAPPSTPPSSTPPRRRSCSRPPRTSPRWC